MFPESSPSLEEVCAIQEIALQRFSKMKGIVLSGVGITRQNQVYALKVNLEKTPPESVILPKSLGGVPVVYDIVGKISKL